MADLKTYLGISDTDIKSVSGLSADYTNTILGTLLNYLRWLFSYKTRVETDSGEVQDVDFTRSVYKILSDYSLKDNMKLLITAEGGLKTRTSGVERYVTKAYDLSDSDIDPAQTTESSQPFFGGRIAPNEIQNFKSVTNESKTLDHTDITVSGTYTLIKVLNAENDSVNPEDSGKTVVSFTEVSLGTYNSISWTGRLYAYAIYGGTISEANQALIEAELLGLVAEVESVTIGTQEWATSNCEMVATPMGNVIPEVTDAGDWADATNVYDAAIAGGSTDAEATQAAAMWCYYNNNPALGAVYGKLYNWYAAKLLQNDIDAYNAAHDTDWGWHVPTQAEFTTLATALGGASVAGGKMKVPGTDYWDSPNTGATNESGFSILPGALRLQTGSFTGLNTFGNSWAITELGSDAYVVSCEYNTAILTLVTTPKVRGRSIRLIKE
jgi:uncharacterized protein (TIGR02145 family)